MAASDLPRLLVRTVEVDPAHPAQQSTSLVDLIPADVEPHSVVSWLREGDGLIGWGRAAVCPAHGPDRFQDAEQWWHTLVSRADIHDEVNAPGTGLVAFGSFSFSSTSADGGGLVVPQVLLGRREGRMWRTTIEIDGGSSPNSSGSPAANVAHQPQGEGLRVEDGAVPARQWPAVIATAVDRISSGAVDKVVLARDITARSSTALSVPTMLKRLSQRYTATWTFAVDGLIGATPEMLVRLQEGQVRSRVLAGTVRRDQHPRPSVTETHPELEHEHRPDPRLHLISSRKDLEEHAFAVQSVAEALTPHCRELEVPQEPFVLELPDVYHLASDLTGCLRDDATSLTLAAALHPSAAVCGTPRQAAAEIIDELEGMDRGRYAGPVGWVDSSGDGDWAIALRCGQLTPDARAMRLFAGGGIIAASEPASELAETEVKFEAMRHALGLS